MRNLLVICLLILPLLIIAQENNVLKYIGKTESYYCNPMYDYYPTNKLDSLGNSLYLINNKNKLYLLQVKDSSNIKFIDSYVGSEIRDYERKDSIVYLATIDKLTILKINNLNINFVSSLDYPLLGHIRDFQLKDTLLIAATRFSEGPNNICYFSIYNISNPTSATLLSSLKCSHCHYAKNVYIKDTIALLTSDYTDTRIVSFSDPEHPYLISYSDTLIEEHVIPLPKIISDYISPSQTNIYTDGEYMFSAFEDIGIANEIGCITLNGTVKYIYGFNNLILTPNGPAGISLLYYDYEPMGFPLTLIQSIKLDGEILSLSLNNNQIFAANSDNKIDILDLFDSDYYSSMSYIKSIHLDSKPLVSTSWSNSLFVSSNDTTIKIIDLHSDSIIASITLPEICNKLIIKDSILYLGLEDRIQIFDISDLNDPLFINSIKSYPEYNSFEVYKNYLIISAGKYGVRILNASDLQHIIEITSDDLNIDYADNSYIDNTTLYVQDNNYIHEYLLFPLINNINYVKSDSYIPTVKNYPNPCSDNIIIEFSSNRESKLKLIIYDFSGIEILSIGDKNLPIGDYRMDIPLENMKNGIYILTLNFDNSHISRKIVVNR